MKKLLIIGGAILGVAVAAIGGLFLYFNLNFKDTFYPNTVINGINVEKSKIPEVEKLLNNTVLGKKFEVKNGEQSLYTLDLTKEGLVVFGYLEELEKIQSKQSDINIFKRFSEKEHKINLNAKIDREKLKETFQEAPFMKKENQVAPQNAFIKYNETTGVYEVVPEVIGTTVTEDTLYTQIETNISNGIYELNLNTNACYQLPTITKENEQLVAAATEANKYLQTAITYDFKERTEVLDKNTISKWISFNDQNAVVLDNKGIETFAQTLSEKYSTVGTKRPFNSSQRGSVTISGGDYGYKINKKTEIENITNNIKEGKVVTREPAYSQTGLSRTNSDIGSTYVEIDLSSQHLWFYFNGNLLVDSKLVTGDVAKKMATPPGVYSLKYKQKDAVLRGDKQPNGTFGYEQPVTYWMPFNGGIGLHDALWRTEFGGTIYQANGSHGCVNLPFNTAEVIFGKITPKTPVILYY